MKLEDFLHKDLTLSREYLEYFNQTLNEWATAVNVVVRISAIDVSRDEVYFHFKDNQERGYASFSELKRCVEV